MRIVSKLHIVEITKIASCRKATENQIVTSRKAFNFLKLVCGENAVANL